MCTSTRWTTPTTDPIGLHAVPGRDSRRDRASLHLEVLLKVGMRLTGGHASGRVIRVGAVDGVRPTSGRVREALFSIVGQDLSGLRVLDAFGGSGLLGFEAWSRGGAVTIVDKRRKVLAAIRATAADLGADVTVVGADALKLEGLLEPFDLVFADPPYAFDPADTLAALEGMVADRIVYEAHAKTALPETVGALTLDRVRTFGGTSLAFYRR